MKKIYVTLFLLVGCGGGTQLPENTPSNSRDWAHFVTVPARLVAEMPVASEGASCQEKIAQRVCLVNPVDDAGRETTSRKCRSGGEEYAPAVVALYETLPEVFQKSLCGLKVIYVEKELRSIAYAGNTDQGGSLMGIRASVLKNPMELTPLISWKEQLLFGVKNKEYESRADYPVYQMSGPALPNSALVYVVLHEIGHVLDFANDVTEDGIFSAFDWLDMRRFKSGSVMRPYQRKICYYDCSSYLELSQASDLYGRIGQTGLLTAYAASNPLEDFAEAVAMTYMKDFYQQEINVSLNNQILLKPTAHLGEESFRPKKEFLQKFLSGPIRYVSK